jgi:hypothetical protein
MTFDADIRHWQTPAAFAAYLALQPRVGWATGSTIHNTYRPLESQWAGHASMQGMIQTYVAKGWTAGPHLFLCVGAPNLAHDGIWQMTPLARPGVHAGQCNPHRFGVEVVGDFEARSWSFAQRALILNTLTALHRWAGLKGNVVGHRDCMAGRTCPGAKAYAALPQLRADLGVRLAAPVETPPPSLPAPDGKDIFVSEPFAALYRACGGFARLGLALTPEQRADDCVWLRCERGVLKVSARYGGELALLSEAKERGWL